jgi:hypothetical protein
MILRSDGTMQYIPHMKTKQSLVGSVFKRLTVLSIDQKRGKETYWNCKCTCGNLKSIAEKNLRWGGSGSCGCLNKERSSIANRRHGHIIGHIKTTTYLRWRCMRGRCLNENDASYHDYGGRGIKISPKWDLFQNFLSDMGECPKGFSLERRDPNKDYSHENCHWIPLLHQQRNKRNTRWVELDGNRVCASVAAEIIGIKYPVFYNLLNRLGPKEAIRIAKLRAIK